MAAIISQLKDDITTAEAEVLRLYIQLQKAEADFSNMMEEEEVVEAARKLAALAESPVYPVQPEGTKLKWTLDEMNYRVAIARNDGILEVKVVVDGHGYYHDNMTCQCKPCGEIALSRRLGVPNPPWTREALVKTFFKDEAAWRKSLPAGGTVTITPKPLSDWALRLLCIKPLTATTDALKLKELEMRFPGATMVLSTDKMQLEIEYMGGEKQHRIYSNTTCEIRKEFSDFGVSTIGKPNLMAEWRGLYIGLEHLF